MGMVRGLNYSMTGRNFGGGTQHSLAATLNRETAYAIRRAAVPVTTRQLSGQYGNTNRGGLLNPPQRFRDVDCRHLSPDVGLRRLLYYNSV